MKTGIHPNWYPEAKVTCACGAIFTVGSTTPEIHVEVCASCHPFYTGEAKFIDTQGRVGRFKTRQSAMKTSGRKVKKEEVEAEEETPKTLREILAEIKVKSE